MTIAEVRLWGRAIGAVSWDERAGLASFEYEPAFAASGIKRVTRQLRRCTHERLRQRRRAICVAAEQRLRAVNMAHCLEEDAHAVGCGQHSFVARSGEARSRTASQRLHVHKALDLQPVCSEHAARVG